MCTTDAGLSITYKETAKKRVLLWSYIMWFWQLSWNYQINLQTHPLSQQFMDVKLMRAVPYLAANLT